MLEDVRVKDGLWSGRAWLSGRQREWQQLQWAEGIPAPSYSCCPRCDEDVGTACIITINRLTAGTECVWWSQWAQKCVRCTFLQTFVISSVSERVCVCLCLMMPFCQLVWSVYAAVKGWKGCKCGCQSVSMYLCVCVNRESGMCLCVSVRQARDQNSLIWMQWGFLRSNRRQRERETQFAFMFCNIYLDFITGNCFSNTNTLVMITKPFNIYFWRVWQRNGKLKLMQM